MSEGKESPKPETPAGKRKAPDLEMMGQEVTDEDTLRRIEREKEETKESNDE
jgi:hypothetical protein